MEKHRSGHLACLVRTAVLLGMAICTVLSGVGYCQDCAQARKLFDQSLNTHDRNQQIDLLKRATSLCPNFAEALNNLGLVYEEQGRFDAAVDAYSRAAQADAQFPHPLAGLGDTYRKMGRYVEAVKAYRRFLDLAMVPEVRSRFPDVSQYVGYVEENMKLCETHLTPEEKRVLEESEDTSMVTAQAITRSLTRRTRGLNVRPSIPIKIHFATNSAVISPESHDQLAEIAKALMDPALLHARIRIEGHTDSVGSDAYNLELSRRRAESVKNYLVQHFGIDPNRLETVGFGETRPVASNDTSWGRAQNRRVELVNLGPAPVQATEVTAQTMPVATDASSPPAAQQPAADTAATAPPRQEPQEKIKIAILEFDFLDRSGRRDPVGRMISEFLTTSAVNSGRFNIVERSLLDKVMKELELGQTGLVEEGKAREIGRMVGASAILTGSVSRLGNTMRIDARLIDVESGEILAAANEITESDMESLSHACGVLVNRLIARLPTRLPN